MEDKEAAQTPQMKGCRDFHNLSICLLLLLTKFFLGILGSISFTFYSPAMQSTRCWAEIDHAALRHNIQIVRQSIGAKPGIMAVIKANAYGHGATHVAPTLAPWAEQFGVATLEEAREVHRAVPKKDILLLSPCLPEERADVVREGFIPVISHWQEAMAYAEFARTHPVRVHLCVDTGMGRIGVWQEEAVALAREIAALKGLDVESISTHLPVADSDAKFTEEELKTWCNLVHELRPFFPHAKFHGLNSAASLRWPHYASDRVRAGLVLYGASPLPEFQHLFQPVMAFKTRITLVRTMNAGRGISYGRDFITQKPMRVATLAVGYADGYPRQISNRKTQVLIRGQRCAVLGRVTMDQVVVDVSLLPEDVAPGEDVVLFGKQGGDEISVHEVAGWANTIAWDILTRLGKRVLLVQHSIENANAL